MTVSSASTQNLLEPSCKTCTPERSPRVTDAVGGGSLDCVRGGDGVNARGSRRSRRGSRGLSGVVFSRSAAPSGKIPAAHRSRRGSPIRVCRAQSASGAVSRDSGDGSRASAPQQHPPPELSERIAAGALACATPGVGARRAARRTCSLTRQSHLARRMLTGESV